MTEPVATESLPSRLFAWEDYAVFAAMLLVSALIGVYHGFSWTRKKKKKKTAEESGAAGEFLIGGGKMQTIPVALSMLAGFLSSITLMGQPAEVYNFGPQIWLLGMSTFLTIPVVSYFVPFFRGLRTNSAYEYFGKRFNRRFQLFASTIFTIQTLLFLALVLYAPALALHQGLNTELVVAAMYIVCIFYTTIGGIKAVVWTDTFQVLVLYTTMILVLVKGTIEMGGVEVVWNQNKEHQRFFFVFDPDPTKKYSMWSTFFGGAFLHLSVYCGNQLQIQRFLSVSSSKEVTKMLWIYAVGWTIVAFLTTYAGMLIFAKYIDCDPILSHSIKTADQLFPLYVMDVLGAYKGFPGLFVAGIFSAGLSTVSSGVNSLATIWFSELDGTNFKANLSPKTSVITVKVLALLFGLMSFGLVFIVPFMGNLVPITISLNGFFSGSLFGIFLLGIFVPFANAWGAFFGLAIGVGFVGWLTVGGQISINSGLQLYEKLPVSTAGCSADNSTIYNASEQEPAPALYRLSFMYYSFLATAITVVVGIVVSYLVNCLSIFFCTNNKTESSFQRPASKDLDKELNFISNNEDSKYSRVYMAKGRELEPKLIEDPKVQIT